MVFWSKMLPGKTKMLPENQFRSTILLPENIFNFLFGRNELFVIIWTWIICDFPLEINKNDSDCTILPPIFYFLWGRYPKTPLMSKTYWILQARLGHSMNAGQKCHLPNNLGLAKSNLHILGRWNTDYHPAQWSKWHPNNIKTMLDLTSKIGFYLPSNLK